MAVTSSPVFRHWLPLWILLIFSGFAQPAAGSILVIGDSLSAGYGLAINSGWVSLLQNRLKEKNYPHQIHNASISGETTAGGLARLPKLLELLCPDIVIVELGGNDGLRGLPLDQMQRNLQTMAQLVAAKDAQTLIVGIRLPPNYGPRFNARFQEIFRQVSNQPSTQLVANLLAGLDHNTEAFQADQIHPSASAQVKMLDNIWPVLKRLLDASSK